MLDTPMHVVNAQLGCVPMKGAAQVITRVRHHIERRKALGTAQITVLKGVNRPRVAWPANHGHMLL
jgi:predicted XRE-type DNA-binding protein